MPAYRLGNGDDDFDSARVADWTNDSSVFGGNGDDTIVARGLIPSFNTSFLLSGGNGDDTIRLDASNSVALGGNGDDLLISSGGGSGMSPGNTLTGGLGQDSIRLISGSGNLVVTGDAGGDGVVSDGDVFLGPIDVITDYQRGEQIALRNFGGAEDLPAPTRVQGAALIDDPLSDEANRFRPVIGDGEYAVFQGTLNAGNLFTVDADGRDLFLVYDTLNGEDDDIAQGSLVLLGVQEEQLMAEAFASSAKLGAADGWGAYDRSNTGTSLGADDGDRGSFASLALDNPTPPSAMGFIAT